MPSAVILLVEYSDETRLRLSALLRAHGFVVREAVHALDALAQLDCGVTPDLILIDSLMPLKDGQTFSKKLSENTEYKKIPAIVISEVAMEMIRNGLSPAAELRESPGLTGLLGAIEDTLHPPIRYA
jgi:CheY-like chemotaxis protein